MKILNLKHQTKLIEDGVTTARSGEWLMIGELPKLEAGFTPKNLRLLMTERNLSSKALAEKLNVKEGTVSRWRNGRATMPHSSWILVLQIKSD